MFSIFTYVMLHVTNSEPELPMFPVIHCSGLFKNYDLHEVTALS